MSRLEDEGVRPRLVLLLLRERLFALGALYSVLPAGSVKEPEGLEGLAAMQGRQVEGRQTHCQGKCETGGGEGGEEGGGGGRPWAAGCVSHTTCMAAHMVVLMRHSQS